MQAILRSKLPHSHALLGDYRKEEIQCNAFVTPNQIVGSFHIALAYVRLIFHTLPNIGIETHDFHQKQQVFGFGHPLWHGHGCKDRLIQLLRIHHVPPSTCQNWSWRCPWNWAGPPWVGWRPGGASFTIGRVMNIQQPTNPTFGTVCVCGSKWKNDLKKWKDWSA